MKTFNFESPVKLHHSNHQFSPSIFLFHFPSPYQENLRFLRFSHRKFLRFPKTTLNLSAAKASLTPELSTYGGWDAFGLGGDSVHSDESAHWRNFSVSVGINDKKHVFMFILGLVCAFAISRVRISKIIIFPASVLVFVVGFSFGFVRGGGFGEVNGSKRRSREELFRVYNEKLRKLVDFFYDFDVRVSNLRNNIQSALDSNRITSGDLEDYVNVVESMRLAASGARNIVEASIDSVGNSNGVLVENQKPSTRRRKEIGEVKFDLSQFLGSFFGDNRVGSKSSKSKDNVKREGMETELNNQARADASIPVVEDRVVGSVNNNRSNKGVSDPGFLQDSFNNFASNKDSERRIEMNLENGNSRLDELDGNLKRYTDAKEYNYQKNRSQCINNRDFSFNMFHDNETERSESHDNLPDSMDFSVRFKHVKSETSFVQEEKIKKSSGAYWSSENREKSENKMFKERIDYEGNSHLADHPYVSEKEFGSSETSKFTDDLIFDKYITEANNLLTEAKEYMRTGRGDEQAEIMLDRSAKLLSNATAMKPRSLLAVGQLGNTYLLHGELKLHISRELRSILSRNDSRIAEQQRGVVKGLDDKFMDGDRIVSLLVSSCQDCEELLVKAGRKYRLALSIDGNDVRSLYNWGLALSFRAQLIADIGPEAAFDADKVFLAAIDKFDAMMSRGNIYAPDALFRWGLTLQQRSRLRPSKSKEKMKLLQQAKRLYEDALHMDSKNLQARHALSSCISELNHWYF